VLRSERPTRTVVGTTGLSAGSTLAGGSSELTSGVDPFALARGAMPLDEFRAGLASRLPTRRVDTLRALLARGASSAEFLADLEKLFGDDDTTVSLLAKGAAMKIAGDRRFVREMAESVVAHPEFAIPFEVLDAVDPVGGRAYVKAVAEAARRRADPALGALPGLDRVLSTFETDGQAALEALAEVVRASATANELRPWLAIATGLRPIPAALTDALTERLRTGTPDEKNAVILGLGEPDADFSAASPAFQTALVTMLVRGDTPYGFRLVRGLGKFPSLSAESAAALGAYARTGLKGATETVAIFGGMGPRAADRVSTLLDLASSLPPDQVGGLASTIVSVGGEGVATFMADRLPKAGTVEVEVWLDGVSDRIPGSRALLEPIAHLSKSPADAMATKAVAAVARIDPSAADETTRRVLAGALVDVRPAVRVAAATSLGALTSLPDDLQASLSLSLADADSSVRRAATATIASSWRLGPAAKPLLPALRGIAADADLANSSPDLVVGALRSLGAIDPLDPGTRATLRSALQSRSATLDMKRAALAGLSRLAGPTSAERAAVADLASDRTLAPLVRAILDRPSWQPR